MLSTLPFVAAVLALKLLAENVFGFGGIVDFADVGMVLTGGVFLIGFMLAGTMADYKEAEKLPAEVACQFEAIEDTFEQAATARAGLDLPSLRQALLDTLETVDGWLHRRLKHYMVFEALHRLGDRICEMETSNAGPYATRALRELSLLRRMVTRISVISRTGFLASGYALLEAQTFAIIVLLLVARFKNLVTEVTLISFVTLIYVYMVKLIRDLDDPFDYHDGSARGAAEVELFPLEEYRERLRSRIEERQPTALSSAK
jgi:hypothetical protein